VIGELMKLVGRGSKTCGWHDWLCFTGVNQHI